jgi:hypothetical protein
LTALAHDASRERIAVADLLAALGDRAIGALMFVFAVPNVLPTPPGTSSLLGAPLVFLAAQLMFGRAPWLPAVVAKRSMMRTDFAKLMARVVPWLAKAERLLKPRLSRLTVAPMEYAIGALCLLLAVVLVLPIPLGNILPALAISLLALGVLEGDGVCILIGVVSAVAGLALVSGVVLALGQGAFYLLARFWS